MSGEYLFVYGTLRRDLGKPTHNLLVNGADFIGNGYLFGKLYEIDNYPGLKISQYGAKGRDKVFGEIYRLKDLDIFDVLDDYEECSEKYPEPHEYKRVKTNIYFDNGDILSAWVYEYNYDTKNLAQIKSGDYTDNLRKKTNEVS